MNTELIEMIIPLDLKYKWSAGPHLGHFLRQLREGKIIANRCPQCKRLQLPPAPVCGRCHIAMGEDWLELSHRGTVISYSFVVDSMYDAGTGDMRPVPYTIAAIVLDGGSDAAFFHKLEEDDPEKVKVGMRVEAVFKPPEEREGLMTDILHFRTIE